MVARARHTRRPTFNLKQLIGSGDRIGMVTAPFLLVGVILNVLDPSPFRVGGPPVVLLWFSIVAASFGVVIWAWSVALILTRVPRGELITCGPYALVRHPLYTGVALLVFPWIGFICNTWLGAAVGVVMYVASRRLARREEESLSEDFGASWDEYCRGVKLPWV